MSCVKRIIKGLNAIEKIALLLSLFYGVGIVSLIQFNSFFTGGECLDFLRIKPILVGFQYFMYLALPFVVLCIPMKFFLSFGKINCVLRIFLAIFASVLLMVVLSVCLHYFFPYLSSTVSMNEAVYYLWITWQFWSMYFYWDFFHFVGIGLIFYISWVVVYRKCILCHKYNIIVLVLIFVINLHYFNKDFYVNIVQSAGGGVPRAGIITITNPTENMKRLSRNYFVKKDEITKPCFILEENNDHFIIADMFNNYPSRSFVSDIDMRASATRVDRNSVKQFSPINYFLGFKNGTSEKLTKCLDSDIVHHLDVVLNVSYAPGLSPAFEDWEMPSYGNITNDVKFFWWNENDIVFSSKMSRVNIGLQGGTNLFHHIVFSGVEFLSGVYVCSLQESLNKIKNRIRIDDLPPPPQGYKVSKVELIFVCNFVYHIPITWKGRFEKGNSLFIESDIIPEK